MMDNVVLGHRFLTKKKKKNFYPMCIDDQPTSGSNLWAVNHKSKQKIFQSARRHNIQERL